MKHHALSAWLDPPLLKSLLIRQRTPACCLCDCSGNQYFGSNMAITGFFCMCSHLLCAVSKLVRKRVPVPANNRKHSAWRHWERIWLQTRRWLGIAWHCFCSLQCLNAGDGGICISELLQKCGSTVYGFLFLSNITVLVIYCAPLAGKLAARFGKENSLLQRTCLINCGQLSFVSDHSSG